MKTIYNNTKKSRLTNNTKENDDYYQVDYTNEVTRLNVEKQKLISFLEDKIKEYKLCFPEVVKALQEVLDFVNKGDKE